MAAELTGSNPDFITYMPALGDDADIQVALKLLLYGETANSTALTGVLTATDGSDGLVGHLNSLKNSLTNYVAKATFTGKGTVLSASAASTPSLLAAGTNTHVLRANSATTTGLEWHNPSTTHLALTAGASSPLTGNLTVSLSTPKLILNDTSSTNSALVEFQDATTKKWEVGKDSSDNFVINKEDGSPSLLINPSGNITTGVWNASVIPGQYGGTGVANTGKTITVSGNTSIGSSTHTVSMTTTGNTSITLPATGTLAITGNGLNQFASTTSAQLATVISNETGSGLLVFNSSPTFDGTVNIPKLKLNAPPGSARILSSTGFEAWNDAESALTNISAAAPTADNHLATLGYLKTWMRPYVNNDALDRIPRVITGTFTGTTQNFLGEESLYILIPTWIGWNSYTTMAALSAAGINPVVHAVNGDPDYPVSYAFGRPMDYVLSYVSGYWRLIVWGWGAWSIARGARVNYSIMW